MKAVVFSQVKQPVRLTELRDPEPGPGDVVVRVLVAPVLSYLQEIFDGTRDYPLELPIVPGCGPIGVVERVGPGATRLRPGQLVFCDPTVRSRDDHVSPDVMLQGLIAPTPGAKALQSHFHHGAFAEKMLLPQENAARLDGLAATDAVRLSWINTLLVPYGGLLAAGLAPGQTVIVNGATGHFGSAAVAVALAMGAEAVVAAGRNQQQLANLRDRLGPRVRAVALSGNEDADTASLEQAAAGGADCLLDMLSPIKTFAPTRTALLALRPHGTAALMGGVQADISLPYSHVMRNALTIRGQFMYPPDAPQRLAALIRAGLLPLDAFESTAFPLEKFEEALVDAAKNGGAFRQTVLKISDA